MFNRSAPVIKLPEGASEEHHLELLGVLNSSTACFWLKQVSHDKGNGGYRRRASPIRTWDGFFEFTGTKLEQFPLPGGAAAGPRPALDALAGELERASASWSELGGRARPATWRSSSSEAEAHWHSLRARMIFEQEELDWEVYRLYGLIDDDLTYCRDAMRPAWRSGERAFEIALARKVDAGEEETAWFDRHGSTPITELPAHWPADYAALVRAPA